MRRRATLAMFQLAIASGCTASRSDGVRLVFPGSNVGAEGAVLEEQIRRFESAHPGLTVELRSTPDSADERHQLYVQWLNAGLAEPDLLQVDVIWTAEMAAAGWLLPLEEEGTEDFFPNVLAADRWNGRLYALPWFVDVGMIYWRSDLLAAPPQTFDQLISVASGKDGFLWQGARYEGLITVFLEVLGAYGGQWIDSQGIAIDSPAALAALEALKRSLDQHASPEAVLTWREEQTRFAFQRGDALFMRNWPYAAALLQDNLQFKVMPLPGNPGGRATAALGGAQLAINRRSKHPEQARLLIEFLTAPEQMIERARIAGQFPARRAVYDQLEGVLPIPAADAKKIVEAAVPRPVTPLYTELSEVLQVWLHRALTGQTTPKEALQKAAQEMRAIERRSKPTAAAGEPSSIPAVVAVLLLLAGLIFGTGAAAKREARTALFFMLPALSVIILIIVVPLLHTFIESFYHNDLRFPWLGRTYAGLDNYLEAAASERVRAALARTLFFTTATVSSEIVLGLVLALLLNRAGRAFSRTIVLLPWALPTVVAALLFRFLFEGDDTRAWLAGEVTAWVPVILSDVWKTTPFVALILLAGLQSIDPALYESAKVDGAKPLQQLFAITLPLLKPAILVAALFRTLDAFRVLASIFTLTGGGPGTATEPIALLTYNTLLQHLRFGYGSALSVIVFAATALLAISFIRILGARPSGAER